MPRGIVIQKLLLVENQERLKQVLQDLSMNK